MSKGFDSSIPSGTDYLETAGLDSVKPKEKQKSLDPFAVFGKKRGKAAVDAQMDPSQFEDVTEEQVREMGIDVEALKQGMINDQKELYDIPVKEEGVSTDDSLEFGSLNPFPYVFRAKYDFKFEENKAKIEALMNTSNKVIQENGLRTPELGGGTTSVVMMGTGTEQDDGSIKAFTPPHAWEEWQHFTTEWLPNQIEKIWEAWRLEPANKYISESWINEHPPGAWTEEHDHQNVTIAMGCYLNVPPSGGRLMFRNPLQTYKYSEPIHHTYWDKSPQTGDDMSWAYLPVRTNDVVFFPGWLRHKTEVNNNVENKSRYIMSINVRYEFARRGSLKGMNNLPESLPSFVGKNVIKSGNSVTNQRVKTREQYDKSIFGK